MLPASVVRVSVGRVRVALCAGALITGAGVSAAPAGAVDGGWTGDYSMVTYASQKTGTSPAAGQPEPDFSGTFTFGTTCTSSTCIATANGPASSNPTVPNPLHYTWNGQSWVTVYDWVWDCSTGDDTPSEWSPARSWTTYTPQSDGTLRGVWHTDISTGSCRGSVVMPVAALPAQ